MLRRFFCSKKLKKQTITIDTSGLIKYGNIWPTNEEIIKIEQMKETPSPLVNHLRGIIKTRGPLTLHEYMAQVSFFFFFTFYFNCFLLLASYISFYLFFFVRSFDYFLNYYSDDL